MSEKAAKSDYDRGIGRLVRMVCDTGLERFGVVEHNDARHVRVRWEDGTVGLLYWDQTATARAFALEWLDGRS